MHDIEANFSADASGGPNDTAATSASTLGGLADQAARTNPDAQIIFPDRQLDYRAFADETMRTARALTTYGIGHGDLVGLMTHSSLSSLITLVAIARVGAIAVPINPRLKPRERDYLLAHSGLSVLFVAAEQAQAITAAYAADALPECVRAIIGLDDFKAKHDLSATQFIRMAERTDVQDVARIQTKLEHTEPTILLYTSGTVANPHGCLHSHESLVQEGRHVTERLGLKPADKFWTPLPIHHCGGIDALVACLAAGCTLCHVGVFDATIALNQLYRYQCAVAFPAFETIWLPVLEHADFDPARLERLRLVVNVGTPERMRAMQQRLPAAVQVSCMGSTESNGFCCLGSPDDPLEARCTTSGVPLPHMQARVVDPQTGRDSPADTPGEFLFRGASRLLYYHRDAEATRTRIDADGWFHSQDLVQRDAEGRLSFICRMSDVLKVGGENVAAAEIEDYLLRHPAVRMAQVVPAPDARYGEVVAAYVEVHSGSQLDERGLIEFCLGEISTFKVPRYVRFVTEWPMSGTKVQKYKLRDRLATELKEAGITQAPRMSSRTPTE